MSRLSPDDYDDVEVQAGSTSYFSHPELSLDPSLFDGTHLKATVRGWILDTVLGFLDERYVEPGLWSRLWIAGSGVSYQWAADRDPGDLDVMLGIDYVEFRQANPSLSGMSDSEIATMLNQDMYTGLYPEIDGVSFGTSNFEVTVYVNMGVGAGLDDIRAINPYAAYDVTADEWSVPPNPNPMVRVHPSWHVSVETDRQRGEAIVRRYGNTLRQIRNATNPAARVNAERYFTETLDAASALYDEIHAGRRAAFSPAGHGYADFANYRWQSGKANGVVQAMRRLKDYHKASREAEQFETYGIDLPDTETLLRRASMTYRAPR